MEAKDARSANGQQAAADYLEEHGLRVLDRTWRCPDGQLDIAAVEGSTFVVCELRTHGSTSLQAMSQAKVKKLRRLGAAWLQAHGIRFDQIRIDVIGVLYNADADDFTIEHVRGVDAQ
jgi:putative endonuclease